MTTKDNSLAILEERYAFLRTGVAAPLDASWIPQAREDIPFLLDQLRAALAARSTTEKKTCP